MDDLPFLFSWPMMFRKCAERVFDAMEPRRTLKAAKVVADGGREYRRMENASHT
jgi:hypothetical protein